ncbi:uncharacterized protein JCM6883_003001 [Sporobolomyces salmoneus]|uniref:uncharacterized protein n=1 Tax=Sporobolomyces salmoneus TaxID=183962 RepID=UPI00317C9C08
MSDSSEEYDYEPEDLVVPPELLIGTPTLWRMMLVTPTLLQAFYDIGFTSYSIGYQKRKIIAMGDIIIVRGHDEEAIYAIYEDDEVAEDVASKLTILLWDFLNTSSSEIMVNTLTDSKIENIHGFEDLPEKVQERVVKEGEYIRQHNMVVELDESERLTVHTVEPTNEQKPFLQALQNVRDPEFHKAMWGRPGSDKDSYGLTRGPRALTEEIASLALP